LPIETTSACCLDHPVLGVEVAALDALGELRTSSSAREEAGLGDAVEQELEGVEGGVRLGHGQRQWGLSRSHSREQVTVVA